MRRQIDLFLEFMIQEKDGTSNTVAAYRNDLNQFLAFVNNDESSSSSRVSAWSDLSTDSVNKYVNYLREDKKYAASTIARKLAAVKSFLHYLHNANTIEFNPATEVNSPKVKKSQPLAISHNDITRLLAEPSKSTTPKSLRDKAIMELLYATGMRVTELIELNVGDIDLTANVAVCGIEGKRKRTVPIGEVVGHLSRYIEDGRPNLETVGNEEALFLNHRGHRLTRQGLWLIIKGYVNAVGIDGAVTPHTLRHSFAAHLLNSGAKLKEVQQRLGHANLSTTQVYQRSADGDIWIDGERVD